MGGICKRGLALLWRMAGPVRRPFIRKWEQRIGRDLAPLDARMATMEQQLGARMATMEQQLGARMATMEQQLAYIAAMSAGLDGVLRATDQRAEEIGIFMNSTILELARLQETMEGLRQDQDLGRAIATVDGPVRSGFRHVA